MSDDFMYDEDDEFEFEYEDDEDMTEEAGIENKYYNAKTLRSDFDAAMKEFQGVVDEEQPPFGEWGFRATKQMIKLLLRTQKLPQVLEMYTRMLEYIKSPSITRNYSEKSVNNMLERVAAQTSTDFTMQLYTPTLEILAESRNNRLWLRTSLRLAKLLLEKGEYKKLERQLEELKRRCFDESGSMVLDRGTQLLEVNAMYLQMYTELKELKRLKRVYTECLAVKSAIPHPQIMGVIRECGGKMHMREKNWNAARSDFFESFKNYDEVGSPERMQILKYLVLASILSETTINPFSSPETRSYQNNAEIIAMTKLVDAYEQQDLFEFERILRTHSRDIMHDSFIKDYITDLRRTVHMQVIQSVVAPYARVRIDALAKRLEIECDVVEEILVALIVEGRLDAEIDQMEGVLVQRQDKADEKYYRALAAWADNVHLALVSSLGTVG